MTEKAGFLSMLFRQAPGASLQSAEREVEAGRLSPAAAGRVRFVGSVSLEAITRLIGPADDAPVRTEAFAEDAPGA